MTPSNTDATPSYLAVSLDDLLDALASAGVEATVSSGGECGAGNRSAADEASHPNHVLVHGMTVDSREITPGNLFVCKGAAFQPRFLADAVARGAVAYLCANDPRLLETLEVAAPGVPHIAVSDVRRAMALAAPVIYDHPDRQLDIIGITGTKGKSTTAYMLRSILRAAGNEPSILGSIDTDDGIEQFESHNTTPESPELWRHLRNTVDAGRHQMIMEVSSQGLKYDRVLGLPLTLGVFLNIGRDHISSVEHPTFEDYFESKLRIFEQTEIAVVNLQSDHVDRILDAAQQAKRVVTFSNNAHGADESANVAIPDFAAQNVTAHELGITFDVVDPEGSHRIELGMAGGFNVDNALAAIACARELGVSWDDITAGLAHIRVPGRMEIVASPDRQTIAIIDYAHNELSFETLFSSVKREYPGRRIIAVFGAPGNKAQERREALPRVAGKYADLIIYTEEDPIYERVEDICAELASHTPAGVDHRIICDREQAVASAIADGRSFAGESVVLLLAKGDETRQHRGDEYPEVKSDLALARELLEA